MSRRLVVAMMAVVEDELSRGDTAEPHYTENQQNRDNGVETLHHIYFIIPRYLRINDSRWTLKGQDGPRGELFSSS